MSTLAFWEIVAAVVKRGYILAEFDRTDLANDKKNVPYALNVAYPDYDPSALMACWRWKSRVSLKARQ